MNTDARSAELAPDAPQHRRYVFFAPAVHMYVLCGSPLSCGLAAGCELELELILSTPPPHLGGLDLKRDKKVSQMAQKPMLRGEAGARALRVRSDVRGHGQVRLSKALGCGKCGCLKPIRACCVVKSAFFFAPPPQWGDWI